MALLNLLWVGLLSGIPIAIVLGLLFTLRSRTSPILKEITFRGGKGTTWAMLWGGALFLAFIVGSIGAWVYGYVATNWGWRATEFLLLGAGLATTLSVLAFLPIYRGKRMTGAADVSALNFIVGVGFGLLVPYVMG